MSRSIKKCPWTLQCCKVEGLILICANAGKTQHGRQLLGEPLVTMVATGLNAQGTGPVILLGEAIIQGFIPGLQPHLITRGILGRRHFQFGQGRDVVVGQLPGFIGLEVLLGAQVTVKHPMRADRRVHQQRLEAMAFGKMGCIVAAE